MYRFAVGAMKRSCPEVKCSPAVLSSSLHVVCWIASKHAIISASTAAVGLHPPMRLCAIINVHN